MAVDLTFLQAAISTANSANYTFSAQNLGATASDRQIIVAVKGQDGATVFSISSVTVAGITATLIGQRSDALCTVGLYRVAVPTGTSGDVVVAWSEAITSCGIGLFRMVGADPVPTGTASDIGADPLSTTINVPADGAAVAVAGTNFSTAHTFTWSGLTERYDDVIESQSRHTGAGDNFATAQVGLTVGCDSTGTPTDFAMFVAAFGPPPPPVTGDLAATEAGDSATAPEERLYPTNPGPHSEFSDANQTQGVRFTTSADGYILGAYLEIASPVPSGTITMRLANATTTLAEKVITDAVSNWKRYDFDSPIAISPGVTYNLYWNYSGSGENRWAATAGVRTTSHLTTSANDFLGSGLNIPNTDFNEDYWVDPIFVTSLGATGTVEWTADIALTEPSDVASIGGTVTILDITGDLAATEAADAAAISGSAVTAGDLVATEAADVAAFSGSSVTAGDLAAIEGADTASASGSAVTAGDLAAVEATDGLAALGELIGAGSLAAIEAGDTASSSGAVISDGSLAAVEAADTAALLGAVDDGAVAGIFAATDAADTAAFAGGLIGQGDLAAIEAQDAAASAGEVISQGGLAGIEASDGLAASGELIAAGDLAAVEQPDAVNAFGAVGDVIAGGLVSTEPADTAALTGQVDVAGAMAAIEAPDGLVASGGLIATGSLAATEQTDIAALFGGLFGQGDLAATELQDSAALAGTAVTAGDLVGIEAPDTAALAGVIYVDGAVAANEAADGLLFVGGVSIDGDVFASEAPDAAALDGIFLEPAEMVGLVRARAGVIADIEGGLSLVGEPGNGLGLVALTEAKPALEAVIESGSALDAEIGS